MSQIARNLTDCCNGFLVGKRYLIHDRDPLYRTQFTATLATTGVRCVKLPPKSPNLNAYAELDEPSNCCEPSSCCGTSADEVSVHQGLTELLGKFDINEYVASVRVFALKPK